ncbi:MAG TPA: response regulator [Nitrosomonas halophila]|nr:response regulator [Nitrosomonas halophila]
MGNTIMIVDDEHNILRALERIFNRDGLKVVTATSGEEGLNICRENGDIAVVISDHRMPGMDGVEFLQRFMDLSPNTIRFMLTGYADMGAVMNAINKGEVYRFITKPWDDENLKVLVRGALEKYRVAERSRRLASAISKQYSQMLELNQNLGLEIEDKQKNISANFVKFAELCADMVALRDKSSAEHCKRVADLAKRLSTSLQVDETEVETIWAAALLHNVGIIGAPSELLAKKEDMLSLGEQALLRKKTVISNELLGKIEALNKPVSQLIKNYVESYLSGGYFGNAAENGVCLGAKIIAVCKAYDKLTYRTRPLSRLEALDKIKSDAGRKYDPAIVDAFTELVNQGENEFLAENLIEGHRVAEVDLFGLRSGMVLMADLVTTKGTLLLVKDTVLSEALIEKVTNFHRIDPIEKTILVSFNTDAE